MGTEVNKDELVALMRRLGMHASVPGAERELPDPVDLDRDRALLTRFGLDVDKIAGRLGGTAG